MLLLGAAPQGDATFEGVTITPARIELDLHDRDHRFSVTIINEGTVAREIRLSIVELGHEVDGAPRLGDQLLERLRTDTEPVFTLPAGASREVALMADFPDQVSLYAAIVASLEPSTAGEIEVLTQVASLVLLRGPRPWNQSLADRGVDVSFDEASGTAVLHVELENVGDAHVRPGGEFIVSQDGTEIARVALDGQVIIPGYARRISAPWQLERELRGAVDVVVEGEDGMLLARGTVELGDLATRVAERQAELGREGSGVAFRGLEGAITPLHWVATGLITLTVLLLALFWRRRRDEEARGVADAPVPRDMERA